MEPRGVVDLLINSHYQAALTNNNVSSAIVRQIAMVGGSFEKAIAAALLSLGEMHAPVTEARKVLFQATDAELQSYLTWGRKFPGFGNAFYKDKIDPAFAEFFDCVDREYPVVATRVAKIVSMIAEKKNKVIYPNAAAATAITAELIDAPRGVEAQLLIIGRLPAWAKQWKESSSLQA